MARYAALAAVLVAVAASASLVFLPTGMSESMSVTGSADGSTSVVTTESHRTTLLATEGRSVLVTLAIPVLVAACLLIPVRRAQQAAAIALTAFCVLGAMSIGFAYLPAAALGWWSLRKPRPANMPPSVPAPWPTARQT